MLRSAILGSLSHSELQRARTQIGTIRGREAASENSYITARGSRRVLYVLRTIYIYIGCVKSMSQSYHVHNPPKINIVSIAARYTYFIT